MLTLSLENDSKSIDLNELTAHEEGVQAVAGLTGLGLPSLTVQWVDGAGDGSSFRGQRVMPRDIDLPLEYRTKSRAALKAKARDLALMLAGPCRLRIHDNEETFDWIAEVRRVGGGDFIYGTETDGQSFLSVVLTLRAGTPYWIQDRTISVSTPGTGSLPATLKVTNPGTAPTTPKWILTGPGISWRLVSPAGEELRYDGYVPDGATRIIDTEECTVVDQTGANRYGDLGPSPRFFSLGPGDTDVALSVDQSSDYFTSLVNSPVRTNFCTNPKLRNNADGWTVASVASYDATNKRIAFAKSGRRSGMTAPEACSVTITGLTYGQPYTMRFTSTTQTYSPTSLTNNSTYGGTEQRISINKQRVALINGNTRQEWEVGWGTTGLTEDHVINFVADSSSVTITVRPGYELFECWDYTDASKKTTNLWSRYEHVLQPGYVTGNVYVGEPGDYFDGDTPATADYTFTWTGTAHASTSTQRAKTLPTAKAKVSCSLKPRDWMVV